MRILIADTYYPEFLESLPFNRKSTYEIELRKVLDRQFGTADFYSKNLRAFGHECVDIVANHELLQQMWVSEYGSVMGGSIIDAQIYRYAPDVLFLQDLSLEPHFATRPEIIAGQCSCPWPGDKAVQQCDVVFTSFPHYVKRLESLGVRAVYLPLAFEASVIEGPGPERDIDISFVGGVGRDSHWRDGTDILEIVAGAFKERFHWYGYGLERLPASSALRACYKGPAWGRDMYRIYRRSKIVINRHGEVAQGQANNLRMFEATGCGAVLLTEKAANIDEFFTAMEAQTYTSPENAVFRIKEILEFWQDAGRWVAASGQGRTIQAHTYIKRMKIVSETLTEMLCPA